MSDCPCQEVRGVNFSGEPKGKGFAVTPHEGKIGGGGGGDEEKWRQWRQGCEKCAQVRRRYVQFLGLKNS